MLHWMRRAAATGVAAALLLFVSGCSWVSFTVGIADFNSSKVKGVWLWRADASGKFQRAARFDFSAPYQSGSGEVIDYKTTLTGSTSAVSAQASVQRLATDPNKVTLVLIYPRNETSGTYRASSFNGGGESALSVTQATL